MSILKFNSDEFANALCAKLIFKLKNMDSDLLQNLINHFWFQGGPPQMYPNLFRVNLSTDKQTKQQTGKKTLYFAEVPVIIVLAFEDKKCRNNCL